MNWSDMANFNPELIRNLRINLPKRRALFVAALTFALASVVVWFVGSNYMGDHWTPLDKPIQLASEALSGIFTVVLFALMFVLAPATIALSFVQERMRGTAIFQQMTLLSPFRAAFGKFFGSAALSYFLVLLVAPLAVIAALIGEVSTPLIARIALFLIVGGFCCQAVALFISAVLAGTNEKALRGGLLISPVAGLLGAFCAYAFYEFFITIEKPVYSEYTHFGDSSRIVEYELIYSDFYGVGVLRYVVIASLLAFVGAWAFAGAVRMVKANQLIVTGSRTLWLFFLSAEALFVGLLWGEAKNYNRPIQFLMLYIVLNWLALAIFAGSSALGRSRLREWWDAGRDPVTAFNRREIIDSLKTFLITIGIAEFGLVALWLSYHTNYGSVPSIDFGLIRLLAIAVCLALTVISMTAFVQYCAMRRFRIGGWAGVALMLVFYVCMVVGVEAMGRTNSMFGLFHPATYAYTVSEGDAYMHKNDRKTFDETVIDQRETLSMYKNDPEKALLEGLLVQSLLAFGCVWLARSKWESTRAEMLHEGA
ncbi:MAG: hypothetical protein WKF74_04300 [Pyrinomonadaceae bacterium]